VSLEQQRVYNADCALEAPIVYAMPQ
jgi:hypothetical protein